MANVVGDNVLLVPMHVDALAVGGKFAQFPDRSIFQWSRLSPDLGDLGTKKFFLGPDLVENPFEEVAKLEPGVHLHFRLPRAFTHGVQSDNGRLEFPRIPNRWLVQRFSSSRGSHVAWLVSSDLPAQEGGCGWPIFPRTAKEKLTLRRIGVWRKLGAPPEPENTPATVKLTAIGPGDPLFSAHYPACRDVLGFYDRLEGMPAARLCYLVTGWFSTRDEDPLWVAAQAAVKQRKEPEKPSTQLRRWLEEQNWICEAICDAVDQGALSHRILCHGFVRGLLWQGPDSVNYMERNVFPSNPKDVAKNHAIAVAENAGEALAAVLDPSDGARALLAALQEDLLREDLTTGKLQSELHGRRFDAVAGGTIWSLHPEAPPDQPALGLSDGMPRRPAELPSDLAELLDDLNEKQSASDLELRRFEACRGQLHALWYLWIDKRRAADDDEGINRLDTQLKAFRAIYAAAKEALDHAVAERDKIYAERDGKQTGTLGSRLDAQKAHKAPGPRYRIARSPAPVFHISAEPAVAIDGPAMQPLNTAERADKLACRLAARVVKGMDLTLPGNITASIVGERLAADVLGETPTLDLLHRSLLAEALLFDPQNGERILILAEVPVPDRERLRPALATIARGEEAANVRLDGERPDRIALFDRGGDPSTPVMNPWTPIMLVWESAWRPDAATAGEGALKPDAIVVAWDVAAGGGDLVARASAPQAVGDEQLIAGQSLLVWATTATLRNRLAKLNKSHALVKRLPSGATPPVVTQSLAGFNPGLVMRQLSRVLPAFDLDRYAPTSEEGRNLYLDEIQPLLADGETPLRLAPAPGQFLPTRDGSLVLKRLNIVDGFGQTLKLVTEGSAKDGLRLRPRLMHPARLRLDWGGEGGRGAICGWIVPNRLDSSLTVHNADGNALGILQKKLGQEPGTKDPTAFFWVDVPGDATADAAKDPRERLPTLIENDDLRHFCRWVLELDPDDGSALFGLIGEQVDAADQRLPEDDAAASLLVGRPLAVARGRLRLEAADFPAHKPELDPKKTGKTMAEVIATRAVERVRWPLRLGDGRARNEGLVGYFRCRGAEAADGPFYAASGRAAPETSKYFAKQDLAIDGVDPLPLVLLVDPQARVHVSSGALPVTTFELPPRALAGGRRAREAFFQAAPVLGFGEAPEIPRPSDDFGEWSWVWRPDVTTWRPAPELVEAAERGGFADRWPTISEGWLKLVIDPPPRIASLWSGELPDAAIPVPPGSNVRLRWSLAGRPPERLELCRLDENGAEESLRVWTAPPFHLEYTVAKIARDTTYRLKAAASSGAAQRDLTVRIAKGGAGEEKNP